MYKRMLVVVGHDPTCDTPVTIAVALAATTGAEIAFLALLRMPNFVWEHEAAEGVIDLLHSRVEAHAALLGHALAMAEAAYVPYTVMLRWGGIPNTIVQAATEADCDLIIMHAPTCPDWPCFAGGYIARKMIALAPQPVLFVGAESCTLVERPQEVSALVVTDEPLRAAHILEYTLTLAEVQALDSACSKPHSYPHVPATTCRGHILTRLAACAAAAGLPTSIPCEHGSLVQMILDTARQRACEVIVFGQCADTGWPRRLAQGVARGLLTQSHLPVLLTRHTQMAYR